MERFWIHISQRIIGQIQNVQISQTYKAFQRNCVDMIDRQVQDLKARETGQILHAYVLNAVVGHVDAPHNFRMAKPDGSYRSQTVIVEV